MTIQECTYRNSCQLESNANKLLLIILFSILIPGSTTAQSQITRGAAEDEIYIAIDWYADNNGVHYAIYQSIDNGETIELKYENLEVPPEGEMSVGKVIGDASNGALYNIEFWNKDLWVSFDFGETWEYQQDSYGYANYFSGVDSGKIFRRDTAFSRSIDYGSSFEILPVDVICPFTEIGFIEAEFYGFYGVAGSYYNFVHTIDYGQSCTEIPVDSAIAFWAPGGNYPKISRGTQPGEIYLLSWQYNSTYKIFLSSDTGYTWTEQFASSYIDFYYWRIHFSAGREPGSLYVMLSRVNDMGDHIWLYIDYSENYGQTFTTWFHDLDSMYVSVPKKELPEQQLLAFPNPFSKKTTIKYILPKNCHNGIISIYNIHGNLLKTFSVYNNEKLYWNGKDKLNREVKKGIYIIRLITECGDCSNRIVIKK